MFEKYKCYECDKLATWSYMPATENFTLEETYLCDDHVPRGCTCNQTWEPIDGDKNNGDESNWKMVSEILDKNGKKLPCCEWQYCEDGYFVNNDEYPTEDDKIYMKWINEQMENNNENQ